MDNVICLVTPRKKLVPKKLEIELPDTGVTISKLRINLSGEADPYMREAIKDAIVLLETK